MSEKTNSTINAKCVELLESVITISPEAASDAPLSVWENFVEKEIKGVRAAIEAAQATEGSEEWAFALELLAYSVAKHLITISIRDKKGDTKALETLRTDIIRAWAAMSAQRYAATHPRKIKEIAYHSLTKTASHQVMSWKEGQPQRVVIKKDESKSSTVKGVKRNRDKETVKVPVYGSPAGVRVEKVQPAKRRGPKGRAKKLRRPFQPYRCEIHLIKMTVKEGDKEQVVKRELKVPKPAPRRCDAVRLSVSPVVHFLETEKTGHGARVSFTTVQSAYIYMERESGRQPAGKGRGRRGPKSRNHKLRRPVPIPTIATDIAHVSYIAHSRRDWTDIHEIVNPAWTACQKHLSGQAAGLGTAFDIAQSVIVGALEWMADCKASGLNPWTHLDSDGHGLVTQLYRAARDELKNWIGTRGGSGLVDFELAAKVARAHILTDEQIDAAQAREERQAAQRVAAAQAIEKFAAANDRQARVLKSIRKGLEVADIASDQGLSRSAIYSRLKALRRQVINLEIVKTVAPELWAGLLLHPDASKKRDELKAVRVKRFELSQTLRAQLWKDGTIEQPYLNETERQSHIDEISKLVWQQIRKVK